MDGFSPELVVNCFQQCRLPKDCTRQDRNKETHMSYQAFAGLGARARNAISGTLLAFALVAATGGASAAPEGSWPEESRGQPLPKPEWILVVPARRGPDGAVKAWDKEDSWTREWIVPRATPSGTRTVAIVGDSEDRRNIEGWSLDEMDVAALGRLASKYSAPAVAVVVEDDLGAAAVAAWMPQQAATWETAGAGDARNGSLATLDSIFSGGSPSRESFDVAITGQRVDGGRTEYRIELAHPIMEDVLRGVPGLDVIGYVDAKRPSLIVSVNDGRDIEMVLRSAGIGIK